MKNNLKIKRIISIILIAVLLVFTTKVYAANDSYETTISANPSSVKRGDSITITIGLANIKIESGEKGIGAYTASIEFDPNVLEYEGTSATNTWEAPFYEDRIITGNTKNGKVVNTNQAIGTITFKVKDDAKLGETIISLTNFSGTTVEKDVTASNKSVKIMIEANDDNSGNNNTGNANNSNNSNANNNLNVKPNGNKEVNNNVAVLPRTGASNIPMFTAIGVCISLAVIFFIKLKIM